MRTRFVWAAATVLGMGALAGCGGGGAASTTTAIAGKVADGYLANAMVFLDKNGNYQADAGEPSTTTDGTGSFTLDIDAADAGKYPIVVVAVQGQTVDLDTGLPVENSYVLSMHAVAVKQTSATGTSGTVSNFVSPVSTLIRETLEANPTMTLAEATVKVRNELGLPAGTNMMADYVFGSWSGSHKGDYQRMHLAAQQMAQLMGAQSALVMSGKSPDLGRYRTMIGQIGQNLPDIVYNLDQGQGAGSQAMQALCDKLRDAVGAVPRGTGFRGYSSLPPFRNFTGVMPPPAFRHYSGLFRNITSSRGFWIMSSGMRRPGPHR